MWHVLKTESKFLTAFQFLTDCQTDIVHESALSSLASPIHVESHHGLHKEVMDKIVQNNTNYEIRIDIRKLFKTFSIGDLILLVCSTDSFQILKKLNCHVYDINFGISSIFNIEDLLDYKRF